MRSLRNCAACGAIAKAVATAARLTTVNSGAAHCTTLVYALAAGSYLQNDSFDLYGVPVFVDLKLAEEMRTGIRMDLFARKA